MDDLISRSAALEAVGDVHPLDYNGQAILHRIQQLPSAVKHGKWITEYDSWGGLFKTVRAHKCSICNHYLDFDGVNAGRGDANYCPNCGARMERSEE